MLMCFVDGNTPRVTFWALAASTMLALTGCAVTPGQSRETGAPTVTPPSTTRQAETATLDVDALAMPRYQEQLGREIALPRQPDSRPARVELVDCSSICDAVEPRQPLLTLMWRDPVQSPGPMAPSYSRENQVRIDVSATAEGFDCGDFGTIDLDDIRVLENAQPYSSVMPDLSRQVLLQRVESGRLVERPPGLPLFRTNSALAAALPSMPGEMQATLQRELQTGSLSQVRVLGRSRELRQGATMQAVTMAGLQPGMTYRFRMVEKGPDGGDVLVEQICRVPVCPADFVAE